MKGYFIDVCTFMCVVAAENRERQLEHNLGDLQVRYKADVENMARELELMKNRVCIVAPDAITSSPLRPRAVYEYFLHCAPNADFS